MGNKPSDSETRSGSTLLVPDVQEGEQESRVMQCQLLELDDMRLWQLQWLLGQEQLLDLLALPPLPQRWLLHASAETTYKLLQYGYHLDGATRVLKVGLAILDLVHLPLYQQNIAKSLGPVLGLTNSQVLNLFKVLRQSKVLVPRTDLDPALMKNKQQDLMQQVQPLESVQILGEVLDVNPSLVKNQRRDLVQQVERLGKVLDLLLQRGVLTTSNVEAILVFGLQQHKTRALLDLLIQKGDQAQWIFLQALSQSEPFLLQALAKAGPVLKVCVVIQSHSSWLKASSRLTSCMCLDLYRLSGRGATGSVPLGAETSCG